nr:hypothetical protein [Tanacetum cinerariifolium]
MPPISSLPSFMACDAVDRYNVFYLDYLKHGIACILAGQYTDFVGYDDCFNRREMKWAIRFSTGEASITLFVMTDDAFVDILMRANFGTIRQTGGADSKEISLEEALAIWQILARNYSSGYWKDLP